MAHESLQNLAHLTTIVFLFIIMVPSSLKIADIYAFFPCNCFNIFKLLFLSVTSLICFPWTFLFSSFNFFLIALHNFTYFICYLPLTCIWKFLLFFINPLTSSDILNLFCIFSTPTTFTAKWINVVVILSFHVYMSISCSVSSRVENLFFGG